MAEAESTRSNTDVEMGETSQGETSPEDESPEGGLHANRAIAGAAAACFCSAGYVNSFGTFFTYYVQNQLSDIPKDEVAWIGSLMQLCMCLAGLISGPWFDKRGAKSVMILGAVFLILSVIKTGFCTEYSEFILAQGIFGGFSCGLLFTPAISLPTHHFSRNRTLAISIAVAGSSLGGVVLPAILDLFLNHWDISFAWTLCVLGVIFSAILTFACIFVNERLPPRSGPWFLPEFNSKRYNALICSLFMISFGLYAPFSDIITHAADIGLPQSGTMLYIVYIASFCSQVMTGKFADKIARVWVLIIVVAINFNLQFSWWLVTEHNILVFVTIYGLTLGPIISMMVAAMAESAPIPHMTGTYIGTSMGIVGIGDLLGTTVTESMTRLPERSWQIVSGSLMCTGYLLLMFVERRMVTPDE